MSPTPATELPTRAALFAHLESISPTRLAEGWDNVGLLLEPPAHEPHVRSVLVTIDLTDAVLAEADAVGAQVIVAYHPPIFSGLKRITGATPTGRRVLALTQGMVAVWSPHTALDAVPDGMNDWLASGLGALAERAPLAPSDDAELPGAGLGRLVTLAEPASLEALAARLKTHLGLSHLRVAAAPGHQPGALAAPITRVALCPGAGGSLFSDLPDPADGGPELYLTGEWRHHDVLAKVAAGASVILTDHSNTERGFLPIYAERIAALSPGLQVHVSQVDADPLQVW